MRKIFVLAGFIFCVDVSLVLSAGAQGPARDETLLWIRGLGGLASSAGTEQWPAL